jgi:hypothetical protein
MLNQILNAPIAPGKRATTSAWADRADELAAWAWERLINRRDVWGGYYLSQDDTGIWNTCQTTHPKKANRGKEQLTLDVLVKHFHATGTRDVIGLHTTGPENTSRWGAVDIDRHGDEGGDPAANLVAALAWYERLRGLGLTQLLTESNGRGGYHLLTVFRDPVPTRRVFAFCRWLVRDYAAYGLTAPPETFPKQPHIDPGRFGNWLRLPGRHHTRPHWSRVWGGSAWLEGAAAARHILDLHGNDPGLIPAVALPAPPRAAAPAATRSSSSFSQVPPTGRLARRIHAYIAKLPAGLSEGQHRDDHGYNLAAFLVRDLALPDAEALPWMEAWDARNAVPKGTARLRKLLADAHKYGRHDYGCGLLSPPKRRGRYRHTILTAALEVW